MLLGPIGQCQKGLVVLSWFWTHLMTEAAVFPEDTHTHTHIWTCICDGWTEGLGLTSVNASVFQILWCFSSCHIPLNNSICTTHPACTIQVYVKPVQRLLTQATRPSLYNNGPFRDAEPVHVDTELPSSKPHTRPELCVSPNWMTTTVTAYRTDLQREMRVSRPIPLISTFSTTGRFNCFCVFLCNPLQV